MRSEQRKCVCRQTGYGASSLATSLLLCGVLAVNLQGQAERGYRSYHAAIHVHTSISNGRHTPEELAGLARQKGVDVLVITDSFLTRASYGVPLLRNLMRRQLSRPGVVDYGIERYFQKLRATEQSNPGLVVVGGLEVTPFYYWGGEPFRNLTLYNFDRHLLVLPGQSEERVERLPVIENPKGEHLALSVGHLALVLLPTGSGIFLLLFNRKRTVRLQLYELTTRMRYRKTGAALLLLGGVLAWGGYPLKKAPWDPYSGDAGPAPYQRVIDYVRRQEGLTFWSYPEARYQDVASSGAVMVSKPHPQSLIDTKGYTGFEALYGDVITATDPGGPWDRVLLEFCRGNRQSPAWGITGLDFHYFQDGGGWYDLAGGQTILWMKSNSREGVLEALRVGRFYADFQADRAKELRLEHWSVSDEKASAISGETLHSAGGHLLARCRLTRPQNGGASAQVRLIRDGQVIAKKDLPPTGGDFEFVDSLSGLGATKTYYRLMVEQGITQIRSNPIFVER